MFILGGGQFDFFGLDMGTLGLRVVQLRGSGALKNLVAYGQTSIDKSVATNDTVIDAQRLGQMIHDLIKSSGITTKNVAVNLPSHRVFTTVVDMDKLSPPELAKTIKYQADSFIPTPLAKSKVDWTVIGDSPKDPKKAEVLLSSVTNEFIESRLDLLEGSGLNVIAMEPDNMALARSIIPVDATSPQLVLDVGSTSTDLVIAIAGTPHLARSIPTGSAAIIKSASQNLAIDAHQAEQFVFKFGLSKDKLESRVYQSIVLTVDGLINEVDKSIKYFQGRYPAKKLERILVTGAASVIPELPLYIANRFGINVEIGNAWRNIGVPSDRQNELMAVSNHFAVAAGLAERVV